MSGGDLTLKQAIEFLACLEPKRTRKVSVCISERDLRLETIIAWWPPEVITAAWDLWRMLEEGTVTATEHGRPIPPPRWSPDRLKRLAPREPTALGPFIREIRRSLAHVRIPAAELMEAFSGSAATAPATASTPELVATKPRAARKGKKPKAVKKPLTPLERKVKAALLLEYPGGRRTLPRYDDVIDRLAALPPEKKISFGRSTLVRVLAQMPDKWRKNR